MNGSGLRLGLLAAAGAALFMAGPLVAAAPSDLEQLKAAVAAAAKEDCPTALKLAGPLVRPGAKPELGENALAAAFEIAVRCDLAAKDYKAAYDHAFRATAFESAADIMWHIRLVGEVTDGRTEAAVATIEAMAQGHGRALNTADFALVNQVLRMTDTGDKRVRRRLLDVIGTTAYTPVEADGPVDRFIAVRASLLAAAGELAEAEASVRLLSDGQVLAKASLDPELRRFFPEAPDVRAATEKVLREARDSMQLHPDQLTPLLRASNDLRILGRPADALALLEGARARLDDPAGFTDRAEHLNWWWDEMGRNNAMLGRYDEAVAAFRTGAAMEENGLPNVSQAINLASVQVRFGRGEEALKTLAPFDDKTKASPYGYMEMRLARGCAKAVAGRPAEAAEDLAYAQAHEKDHPEALGDLLLCLGDMDGAAAAFIRRLDDPNRRIDALLQLSDYEPPLASSPQGPIEAKLPALKARADVKAAIARAGGLRRFNVQASEL